ncbi:hypothetical protein CYMTET_44098 [Cymbomonas tetramitiformis]|uniref:Chromo domain-containing protein n=1 Tax=Cymbomonas tetramitiformis TaxID=36881 RepID=A0AAE0C0U6_9CHLO|nr:hypothetical protein CYMTET_44098 [Cymbomonas tetramitiformis]
MGKRGRASRSKRASSTGVTLVAQGKGKVKRTQQSPFDPAGSDNTEYFVREVKAERVKGFTTQWLIGWEGFSDREDTWEPIEHLAGYETEIRVFRERKKEEAAKAESDAAAEKQKKADEKEAVVVDGKLLNYLAFKSYLPSRFVNCNKFCEFVSREILQGKMARQFLGVPASTAGVERAFSSVTFMHSDLRKSLAEGTIQHSLMAAMN